MSEFSTKAAEQLFARYPDWQRYAKSEKDEDGSGFIRVEVPAPAEANAVGGLIVSTANDEVTVEFDYYHSHFDEMVGDGSGFGTDAALSFIEEVLAEKVAAVSWWNGEQWRGSTLVEAGQKPQPNDFTRPFDRVRIRSWKGTLNADVAA